MEPTTKEKGCTNTKTHTWIFSFYFEGQYREYFAYAIPFEGASLPQPDLQDLIYSTSHLRLLREESEPANQNEFSSNETGQEQQNPIHFEGAPLPLPDQQDLIYSISHHRLLRGESEPANQNEFSTNETGQVSPDTKLDETRNKDVDEYEIIDNDLTIMSRDGHGSVQVSSRNPTNMTNQLNLDESEATLTTENEHYLVGQADRFPGYSDSSSSVSPLRQTMTSENMGLRNQSPQSAAMARAGFYDTGVADQFKCSSCGLCISLLESEDDPLSKHTRLSPDCPFLQTTLCGVEPPVSAREHLNRERGPRTENFDPVENILQSSVGVNFLTQGYPRAAVARAIQFVLPGWQHGKIEEGIAECLQRWHIRPRLVNNGVEDENNDDSSSDFC